MRSYYAHLATTDPKPEGEVPPRPTLRSSAIFPVIQEEGISSRILFMGYWMLKRQIHEITCVITLRNHEGDPLHRQTLMIREAKTYRIELSDQLAAAGLAADAPFMGSLEVEFFSIHNLVFPYPAAVINYYGPQFSSVVHTAQRVYNDFDDMQRNSVTEVPESGFNIYADEAREPFFALINGLEPMPGSDLTMEFFNADHETLALTLPLDKLAPYETRIIHPAQLLDLKTFLKGQPGAAKVRFHVNWAFPRLVAGNIDHSLPALSITHTYYDCTKATSDTDYWQDPIEGWHPAALMIPVTTAKGHFTNIYFYPIYSPSTFTIDIEIYDTKGTLLGKKEQAATITSPSSDVHKIALKELCQELGIAPQPHLGARIIARGTHIPSRIKIGIDQGAHPDRLPCNICANLQPTYPPYETKPHTFRWAPILADQKQSTIWIMNSSPKVDHTKEAEVEVTFFREQDTTIIQRKITIPPQGFLVIDPEADSELKEFFKGKIGWMTAISTNPYTTTYYFAENASGIVGGDHGF